MPEFVIKPAIKNTEDFKNAFLSDLRDNPIEDFLQYTSTLNCPVDAQTYYYKYGDELHKQGLITLTQIAHKPGSAILSYERRRAVITIIGLEHLSRIEMNKLIERQAELNNAANKSVIETNDATKSNFIIQNKLTQVSLILSGLSAVFVLASVYATCRDKTSQELQSISTQLQQQVQELKSLQQYQKGIDSSLKIIVKDSLKIR